MRIAITGAPRTGKTTLASEIGTGPIIHTDDYLKATYDDVVKQLSDNFIIEGTLVPWVYRHIMQRSDKIPLDRLIILTKQWKHLTSEQITLKKSINTVLNQILPGLRSAGIEVEHR